MDDNDFGADISRTEGITVAGGHPNITVHCGAHLKQRLGRKLMVTSKKRTMSKRDVFPIE